VAKAGLEQIVTARLQRRTQQRTVRAYGGKHERVAVPLSA
jgi:hypothetical protein